MPEARISRQLNIVITLETEDGPVYVHSTPVSRETFERYYRPMARAFAMINMIGAIVAGPKTVVPALRDVASELGVWDGQAGVERGLLAEIRRLTNVVMPADSAWRAVPFQEVIDRKLLCDDDLVEAEGAVVFFMLASATQGRAAMETILNGMTSLWGARSTSSNSTEYARSLPISTATGSSGGTATISSVPS